MELVDVELVDVVVTSAMPAPARSTRIEPTSVAISDVVVAAATAPGAKS